MKYSIEQEIIYEEKVKSSLFIAHLNFANDVKQAKDYILQISKKHNNATHNCWAYMLNSQILHFSDAGEPSGSAGKPILSSLQKHNLQKIVCVISRYFKGQKLGIRGLIAAYSSLCEKAILKSNLIELKDLKICSLFCSYKNYTYLKYIMQKYNFNEEEKFFLEDKIKLKISFESKEEELIKSLLKDYCQEIEFLKNE